MSSWVKWLVFRAQVRAAVGEDGCPREWQDSKQFPQASLQQQYGREAGPGGQTWGCGDQGTLRQWPQLWQSVNNVFTGRGHLSSDVHSSLGGVSRENQGIRTRVWEVSFSVRGLFVVTFGDLEPFLSHIIETIQLWHQALRLSLSSKQRHMPQNCANRRETFLYCLLSDDIIMLN